MRESFWPFRKNTGGPNDFVQQEKGSAVEEDGFLKDSLLLREIFPYLPYPLIIVGRDFHIKAITQAASDLLGLGPAHLLQGASCQHLGKVLCGPGCSAQRDFFQSCLNNHARIPFRNRILLNCHGKRIAILKTLSSRNLRETSDDVESLSTETAESLLVGSKAWLGPVLETLRRISDSDLPVLISGETGTGKGVFAQFIHTMSGRNHRPFVTVDLSLLPETLVESLLFGHEKGAFTGATSKAQGKFADAEGGTIFLDEIENIPLSIQAKLLQFLENRRIVPLGSRESREVQVRFLSATNREPEELIRLGLLRSDLYYRIGGFRLNIPPLRERKEDIPLMVEHFCLCWSERTGRIPPAFSEEVMALLMEYPFPGNVRELKNLIELLLTLSQEASIGLCDLPSDWLHRLTSLPQVESPAGNCTNPPLPLEKEMILDALRKSHGKLNRAAEILNISYPTLWRKIRKYNIVVK